MILGGKCLVWVDLEMKDWEDLKPIFSNLELSGRFEFSITQAVNSSFSVLCAFLLPLYKLPLIFSYLPSYDVIQGEISTYLYYFWYHNQIPWKLVGKQSVCRVESSSLAFRLWKFIVRENTILYLQKEAFFLVYEGTHVTNYELWLPEHVPLALCARDTKIWSPKLIVCHLVPS